MARRIRVLRVQHNFVEPTNHALLDELEKFPELDVRALCPVGGIESGNRRVLSGAQRHGLNEARTLFTRHYATTFYIEKLGAMIRGFQPDILSVHEEPWSLSMGQALVLRRLFAPQARLVFVSAQNILKKYPFPFGSIERATYATAASGYGCCEGVREVVRAKGYEGPFEIMPLGLNPDLFGYRPRDADLQGRTLVIGYAGRLVDEKGVFTLVRAFSRVRGPARLALLGSGPAREPLLHEAAALGVSGALDFQDPVPHAEVPAVVDRFDVLVAPSETTPTWKEQFGRVIAEAMSMGIPVVGSDSGSVPEVIGDAGLVFPEKDAPALAACLQSLIDNPGRLAAMSAKGRARALERFTWKTVAQQTRDLFMKVMDAPR